MQTPGMRDGIEQLRGELAEFRYSLFRLKTLHNYSGRSEDDAFAKPRSHATTS